MEDRAWDTGPPTKGPRVFERNKQRSPRLRELSRCIKSMTVYMPVAPFGRHVGLIAAREIHRLTALQSISVRFLSAELLYSLPSSTILESMQIDIFKYHSIPPTQSLNYLSPRGRRRPIRHLHRSTLCLMRISHHPTVILTINLSSRTPRTFYSSVRHILRTG